MRYPSATLYHSSQTAFSPHRLQGASNVAGPAKTVGALFRAVSGQHQSGRSNTDARLASGRGSTSGSAGSSAERSGSHVPRERVDRRGGCGARGWRCAAARRGGGGGRCRGGGAGAAAAPSIARITSWLRRMRSSRCAQGSRPPGESCGRPPGY